MNTYGTFFPSFLPKLALKVLLQSKQLLIKKKKKNDNKKHPRQSYFYSGDCNVLLSNEKNSISFIFGHLFGNNNDNRVM